MNGKEYQGVDTFVDIPEEGFDFKDKYSTYNGLISPRTLIGDWAKFKDKNLSKDILLSYGYGGGGGGVNRDMLEMARVLDKLPGVSDVLRPFVIRTYKLYLE